jgi:transcriptional regulator with PAS, ATPase and Fis domain
MQQDLWFKSFPGSITITDAKGIILEMNEKAAESYRDGGGYELIGKSAINCHEEPVRQTVQHMYDEPAMRIYKTRENGQKILVTHAPFFSDDRFMGIVELVIELPEEIPHVEH